MQREVAPDMAMNFCEIHNLQYCENSAKEIINLDLTFDTMLRMCVESNAK
jgi:hypothetical protein